MSISSSLDISLTFTPPTFTLPPVTSQNLATILARVVLPSPDGPTNATCSPALMVREISLSAFLSASLYRKETSESSTELSFGCFGCSASGSGCISRMLSMRDMESATISLFSLAYMIFVSVSVMTGVMMI